MGTDVGRMARDLNALFKIANTINSIRDLEALQKQLLELICEVIPADSAAVVISRQADDDPRSSCTWSRKGGDSASLGDPARHCAAGAVGTLGYCQPSRRFKGATPRAFFACR